MALSEGSSTQTVAIEMAGGGAKQSVHAWCGADESEPLAVAGRAAATILVHSPGRASSGLESDEFAARFSAVEASKSCFANSAQ